MDERKLEKIESDIDLEQEARDRPAEPVVVDLLDILIDQRHVVMVRDESRKQGARLAPRRGLPKAL